MSDECGMHEERTDSFDGHMADAFKEAAEVDAAMRSAVNEVMAAHARNVADSREAEDAERLVALERAEELRRLAEPKRLSADSAEVVYLADELDSDIPLRELVPQAVLGRKMHRGKLYYKILWRARGFATWEREGDTECKALIESYERCLAVRARMPPSAARLRPVVYTTRRQIAQNPQLAALALGPGDRAVWLCEVEPMVWIPYDDEEQAKLEAGRRAGAPTVLVAVGHSQFTVHLGPMLQKSGIGGDNSSAARRVMRQVQLRPDREAVMMADMSLPELRRYIASIVEFQPVHYEALVRLHAEDKVVVHASKRALDSMPASRFAEIVNRIADGEAIPFFSDDCFVCLEDYGGEDVVMQLPCGHYFHKHCATDYFTKYSTLCPVCKLPIE